MATISNTFDYSFILFFVFVLVEDFSFIKWIIYGGTNGTRSPDPPFVGDENSEAVNKTRYVNKNWRRLQAEAQLVRDMGI